MTRWTNLVWVVVLGVLVVAGVSLCAPPDSGGDRPTDKELLKELNARSGDDLDRELFGPDSKGQPKDAQPKEGPAAKGDPQKDLPRELGRAGVSESDNPLVDIARQMREAERLIAQEQSGDKTQKLQDDIIKELDELLKKVCKQCGGQCTPSECKNQGVSQRQSISQPKSQPKPPMKKQPPYVRPKERSPKSLNPTQHAQERPTTGKNGEPNMAEMKETLKGLWGNLPEREREQMLQFLPEKFLPKYDLMIEEYFKRLADDKAKQE